MPRDTEDTVNVASSADDGYTWCLCVQAGEGPDSDVFIVCAGGEDVWECWRGCEGVNGFAVAEQCLNSLASVGVHDSDEGVSRYRRYEGWFVVNCIDLLRWLNVIRSREAEKR